MATMSSTLPSFKNASQSLVYPSTLKYHERRALDAVEYARYINLVLCLPRSGFAAVACPPDHELPCPATATLSQCCH